MKSSTVVIYRVGSLGDTIVALPLFNALSKYFANSRRIVLTNFPVSAKAAPLMSVLGEDSGIVSGAMAYPISTRSPSYLFKLMLELRALDADTLVYLMPSRGAVATWRDWLFFKLAGFKHILGLPASASLRCNTLNPSTGDEEPEARRLARCFAGTVPVDIDSSESWDLKLSAVESKAGRAVIAPLKAGQFLAINMGGKASEKDWGIENWSALMAGLRNLYPHFGLLVVGAEIDSERARQLISTWSAPAVDACGRLSPRESAAAIGEAALFIGHDSGPLHLAATTGIPCLGLFGNFNRPRKWHPIGRRVRVIHNMAGINAITAAEVETAVRDMLSQVEDPVDEKPLRTCESAA